MKYMRVIGEDALCCSLGERMVGASMPGWQVHGQSVNTGGITRLLPSLTRYADQARHIRPVLCIADTDGKCPVHLLGEHLPQNSPAGLLVRFAVPEAECWVMADRVAVSNYFQVDVQAVPRDPEGLPDAKQELLRLAKRSKLRLVREEVVVATNPLRQGAGYNMHLAALVATQWNAERARENSASLRRALNNLEAFALKNA